MRDRRKGQNAAAAYRAKVLATSPIAYWPLNEASGAVAVCLNDSDLNGSYSGPTLANAAGPFAPDMAPYFDGAPRGDRARDANSGGTSDTTGGSGSNAVENRRG